MKRFLFILSAVVIVAACVLAGCASDGADGLDGRDGKDGTGVTVQDLYEAARSIEGNEDMTLDEFLREYLSYTESDIDNLQATMNASLMSGVSILTRFSYTVRNEYNGRTSTSYEVYTGSGVIIDIDREAGDAYVVTNCHVIYDSSADHKICNDVRLYLYGQDVNGINYSVDSSYSISGDENYRIEAEVIGASITYDIALLKVEDSEVLKRSDATAAVFSDDADVYVGETVYAVGNSSGEGLSAHEGIISRDSEYVSLSIDGSNYVSYRVIRTTAPINGGNSGGMLCNSAGEIVGIINSKDGSSDVDNMGYALPAFSTKYLVDKMLEDYEENGFSDAGGTKALANITIQITDSYSRYNSDTGLAEIYETVKISEITGAPAKGAMEVGDIFLALKITGSDGAVKLEMDITRRYHITESMLLVRLGDTITYTVQRRGEEITVSIPFDSEEYFTEYA